MAKNISAGLNQIVSGVQAIRSAAADQPLTITVTPSFAENWLMPRMGQFWEEHPELPVTISASQAVVDLNEGGFDLAIRYGDGNWGSLETEFLVKGDFVAVASPKLLGDKRPNCISQMLDLPWYFTTASSTYQKWAKQNGLDPSIVSIRYLETISMIIAAVRAGSAASVMIRAMVEDDIKQGRLIAVQELQDTVYGYHIVAAPNRDSSKVRVFRKWLRSQI